MHLSLDEMTMGFQGRCVYQIHGETREGDGFQCDCLCESGYCFTFWFRCDLPPRPVPSQSSPRDDRCAWLLERLPGMWYRVWMDNLFTSWKFGEICAQRSYLSAGTCQTADWRGRDMEIMG